MRRLDRKEEEAKIGARKAIRSLGDDDDDGSGGGNYGVEDDDDDSS